MWAVRAGHKSWQLAKTLELQRQTEAEKLKRSESAYGTFARRERGHDGGLSTRP